MLWNTSKLYQRDFLYYGATCYRFISIGLPIYKYVVKLYTALHPIISMVVD